MTKFKTTVYITAWDDNKYNSLVEHLRLLKVKNPIIRINEKTHRPISMNKIFISCKTEYICFMECDIRMYDTPFIQMAEEILDTFSNIGMVAIPGEYADFNNIPDSLKPPVPLDAPLHVAIKDLKGWCPSLHCAFLRVKDGFRFDEDYLNHQVFDIDFAYEIAYSGKLVVADGRHLVYATKNHYEENNLLYHAMVTRNNHLLNVKWANRAAWKGPEGIIPCYNEMIAWSEEKLFKYMEKEDPDSFFKWIAGIKRRIKAY